MVYYIEFYYTCLHTIFISAIYILHILDPLINILELPFYVYNIHNFIKLYFKVFFQKLQYGFHLIYKFQHHNEINLKLQTQF